MMVCQYKKSSVNHCFGSGVATVLVTVVYGKNFNGSEDIDVLALCPTCAARVKKDAESHGYVVRTKEV